LPPLLPRAALLVHLPPVLRHLPSIERALRHFVFALRLREEVEAHARHHPLRLHPLHGVLRAFLGMTRGARAPLQIRSSSPLTPAGAFRVYRRLPREGRRRGLERDRAVEAVRMNGGAKRFAAALRAAGAQHGGREVWEELAERYGERWRRGVCLLAVRWGRSSWLCRT